MVLRMNVILSMVRLPNRSTNIYSNYLNQLIAHQDPHLKHNMLKPFLLAPPLTCDLV